MSHNARFISYHYYSTKANTKEKRAYYLTAAALALGAAYIAKDQLLAQAEEAQEEEKKEEVPKPPVTAEAEDYMGSAPSNLKDVTVQTIREVFGNKENKFIYFYRKSTLNTEEQQRVEDFAQKIANGMRVVPYKLDLDETYEELEAFLKERNPKTASQTAEQIQTHRFLLANQYDDIWYWELDLINYFYGELLEQIFNFFQGPLRLQHEEQLLMNQSGDNDFHVIAYQPEHLREETVKNLKNFRKFNTKNTDKFFHFKFWVIENPELAKALQFDTADSAAGDVYIVRPVSTFNLGKPNARLQGYEYTSTRILTGEEIMKDVTGSGSYAKILEHAFNSPIIVRDYMQFAVLTQKFKTNVLVVYCDPEKDPVFYQKALKTLVRARKNLPINLIPDAKGELQKQQRHADVLFVLSTVKNLMPVVKIHEDGPQAVFVTPEDNIVDLFAQHLPSIELIEGLPKDEFMRKARNNEQEFAYTATDDDRDRNRKDTAKMIYSPDRYQMPRMHHTADKEVLTNPEKLLEFVNGAVLNQVPLYWETEKVPKAKHSQKVVGEDFEKRILDSKRDSLVLIHHPVKEYNRKILSQYEELARVEKVANKDVLFARYNGVNESQGFKSPEKLPALVYFKAGSDQPITFEGINELLAKGVKEAEVQERIRQFVQNCKASK